MASGASSISNTDWFDIKACSNVIPIKNMFEDFVEQHRRLGKAVAEIVSEHVSGLANRRVTPEATPEQLEKLFDEPLPEKGSSIDEILARFRDHVAPHAMGVPSPRYFGQFNPTPLP